MRAGLTGTALAVVVMVGGTSARASSTTPPPTDATSGSLVVAGSASTAKDRAAKAEAAKDKAAQDKADKDKADKADKASQADKDTKPNEAALSPAQVAAQVAQADALTDDLTRTNAAIAAAATKLDRYAKQANTLLQQYSEARIAERTAIDEANRNVALYRTLSAKLGEDRKALGQWAYQAYAGGGGGTLGDVSLLFEALGKDASEASDTAAQLSYLSDQRTWAFNKVEDNTALQQVAAVQAVEASTRAKQASATAATAKKKLDAAIAEQKAQLETTRALHAAQVSKIGPIAGLLLGSETEAGKAATARLRKAMIVPGVKVDGSVKACSTNELEYPNGAIPVAGLCPLYADPAESLRPGAAAAFNAMSIAYERDTGSPICITDSYRSYAEQVSVKADRGKWAATPGRSEHGYGRAVDLCGGIQSFGSSAHLWMKQNAPLYGWFHPSWAEPNGSLPEPWHWEYAG